MLGWSEVSAVKVLFRGSVSLSASTRWLTASVILVSGELMPFSGLSGH